MSRVFRLLARVLSGRVDFGDTGIDSCFLGVSTSCGFVSRMTEDSRGGDEVLLSRCETSTMGLRSVSGSDFTVASASFKRLGTRPLTGKVTCASAIGI